MRNIIICILSISIGFCTSIYAQDFEFVQRVEPSNLESFDFFGSSVEIFGDLAMIGNNREDLDENGENPVFGAGMVEVFEKNGSGDWELSQVLTALERKPTAFFGTGLDIQNDQCIISANAESPPGSVNDQKGAIYIFKKNNNGIWSQEARLVASHGGFDARLGWDVSIYNEYALAGAATDSEDENGQNTLDVAGSATLFKKENGIWSEHKRIVASDREPGDLFGSSVLIHDQQMFIGARNKDSGVVYCYKMNETGEWEETQKLSPQSGSNYSLRFGANIIFENNVLMVGASREDSGIIYVYSQNADGEWIQIQKIIGDDPMQGDELGQAIDLSGNYAVFGVNHGLAYIYEKQDDNLWIYKESIIIEENLGNTYFSSNVSIFGNEVLISAPYENNEGAAYFYNSTAVNTTEIYPDLSLTLQPNPTSDRLYINSKSELYAFEIFDSNGKNVMGNSINRVSGIDVSSLKTGIYLIRLHETSGLQITSKFIKI